MIRSTCGEAYTQCHHRLRKTSLLISKPRLAPFKPDLASTPSEVAAAAGEGVPSHPTSRISVQLPS